MTLWPLALDPSEDSYPLSTYPMFAKPKPDIVTVNHIVALDAEGERRIVPPAVVGRGEVMQTRVALRRAVRQGGRAARALCREVAARLAEDEAWASAARVEVRTDRFEVATYFESRQPIEGGRVHARCRLKRGPTP